MITLRKTLKSCLSITTQKITIRALRHTCFTKSISRSLSPLYTPSLPISTRARSMLELLTNASRRRLRVRVPPYTGMRDARCRSVPHRLPCAVLAPILHPPLRCRRHLRRRAAICPRWRSSPSSHCTATAAARLMRPPPPLPLPRLLIVRFAHRLHRLAQRR